MILSDQLREKLRNLPDKPGCYMMRDRKGEIIYVGKAVSLRRRVQSYFRDSTLHHAPPKVRSMVHCIADLETMTVRNEAEALLTESRLIKQYKPYFNILMRDDKRYPALRADPRDPVPRIVRCRIIRDDPALYFGPFPSDTVVKAVLDFTEKRFGLRKCNPILPDAETHKHCHNDILRFCCAPCIGRVTPEEYRARFDEACAFLRGERLGIIEEVRAAMEKAAGERDYEKAAAMRDTWLALREMVRHRYHISSPPEIHALEAHAGIVELQSVIGLPSVPTLIEGFDISNLFGTNSVASMVAAVDGIPDARLYRRFRIKTVQGADDPRSMAEVIGRRYARVRDEGKPFPGLILIDGGITQLRAARQSLAGLGLSQIPSVGLAKQQEEIVTDDGRQPILLPRDSAALTVLRRLRDEAHRFAITYHRRLRNKLIRESALDEIPGIGPAKKMMLLQRYGSVSRLAKATQDEIARLPGIGDILAAAILRAVTPGDGIQRGAE
jgi:excinuclease ABC subunit C